MLGITRLPSLPTKPPQIRIREREKREASKNQASMASAATTKPIFPFLNLHKSSSNPRPFKSNPPVPKNQPITLHKRHVVILPHSVDVSQDDKPLSQREPNQEREPPIQEQEELSIDPRRLEEKFAVINTGVFECTSCGYKYDESVGDSSYPIPPGLPFSKLPEDWRCPTCGAAQSFFQSKSVEIAGFAQNQQFGLGGNTLTSGQKALLIYGSLGFAFALFLSGYFLQ